MERTPLAPQTVRFYTSFTGKNGLDGEICSQTVEAKDVGNLLQSLNKALTLDEINLKLNLPKSTFNLLNNYYAPEFEPKFVPISASEVKVVLSTPPDLASKKLTKLTPVDPVPTDRYKDAEGNEVDLDKFLENPGNIAIVREEWSEYTNIYIGNLWIELAWDSAYEEKTFGDLLNALDPSKYLSAQSRRMDRVEILPRMAITYNRGKHGSPKQYLDEALAVAGTSSTPRPSGRTLTIHGLGGGSSLELEFRSRETEKVFADLVNQSPNNTIPVSSLVEMFEYIPDKLRGSSLVRINDAEYNLVR